MSSLCDTSFGRGKNPSWWWRAAKAVQHKPIVLRLSSGADDAIIPWQGRMSDHWCFRLGITFTANRRGRVMKPFLCWNSTFRSRLIHWGFPFSFSCFSLHTISFYEDESLLVIYFCVAEFSKGGCLIIDSSFLGLRRTQIVVCAWCHLLGAGTPFLEVVSAIEVSRLCVMVFFFAYILPFTKMCHCLSYTVFESALRWMHGQCFFPSGVDCVRLAALVAVVRCRLSRCLCVSCIRGRCAVPPSCCCCKVYEVISSCEILIRRFIHHVYEIASWRYTLDQASCRNIT